MFSKSLQHVFTALFFTAMAAGCGSDIKKDQCASDGECGGGFFCSVGVCVDEDAINGASNNGTLNNGTSNNGASNNGALNNGTSNNGTSNDGTSNNGTSNNGTSSNGTSSNGTSNNGTSNNSTSNNTTEGACVVLSEESEINFGAGTIGSTSTKTVLVENCSRTVDLRLSELSVCEFQGNSCVQSAAFGLEDLPGNLPTSAHVIEPREMASFVITYTPLELRAYDGELVVHTNDPAKPALSVALTGSVTDEPCPVAQASARVSGTSTYSSQINTIPLNTVELRGSNSTSQSAIDRYEWSFVQRPPGSTVRLAPSDTVADPSLFLDLAGRYVLELKVYSQEQESCGSRALVTIDAVPDEDIHIQLVWDTPGDPDQTDASGTDLDIHLLHPLGDWNSQPYDVFWNNPSPDWGAPGPDDDPSLDIDDTDGAGPENINYDNPESGITYAVGVYYYADNGYGPSHATVRIYIGGQQVFEYKDRELEDSQTFWYVATISWPSQTVSPVNQISDGFPNAP